jgi:hypothetical protein
MSNGKSSGSSGGIGFAGALTLLFVGLKLGHIIDWSWWWVVSPLWITAGLVVAILVLGAVFILIKAAVSSR